MRGTALLWDLQLETARNLWRTQARTAAMLGVPDYSHLFSIGDARRVFTMGAEQVLNSARQARETMLEVQRQIGRLAEEQTIGLTEEVREQVEQIGRHTAEGLQEIEQMGVAEVEDMDRVTRQAMDTAGDEQQQGGEQREFMDNAAAADRDSGGNEYEAQDDRDTAEGGEERQKPRAGKKATKRRAAERPRSRRSA